VGRTRVIGVRLTPVECAKLAHLCKATSRNQSDILRLLLRAATPPDAPAIKLEPDALESAKGGRA
jgi:hypothetical protein